MQPFIEFYLEYQALPLVVTAIVFLLFCISYAALMNKQHKRTFLPLFISLWVVLVLPQIVFLNLAIELEKGVGIYELTLKPHICAKNDNSQPTVPCLVHSPYATSVGGYYLVEIEGRKKRIDSCLIQSVRRRSVDEYR